MYHAITKSICASMCMTEVCIYIGEALGGMLEEEK
jgi:hypothetical protein